MAARENVSADLIWQICNGQNAYLVKRKQAGGVQLSRDPMNLTNKHARIYEGFVNDKAIGIQVSPKAGLVMTTKKTGSANKPASSYSLTKFGANVSSRKQFRSIVTSTAKRGYRADLRADAVARASALRQSQKAKKDAPAAKPRGAKAAKAVEASA